MLRGLTCEPRCIQFLFSPNRGRDIGGFFLQLDQVIKQGIQHDYIIKIHSKKSPHAHALWRKLNTSFLRININPLLQKYACVYSNRIACNVCDNGTMNQEKNCDSMSQLFEYFNLPPCDCNFCGGTMFVVSQAFTEFFKKYDLLELFNMLDDEIAFAHALDGRIEHAYERFFGYLIEYLGLKTYCLDYQPSEGLPVKALAIPVASIMDNV
jgi:hypothetical protein